MWNTEAIAAISSLVMAVIWLVYLNIFWGDLRRRNRPSLVIHHATGQSPQAPCMLVNMSREPVHVQCVIARVTGREGRSTHYLTEYTRFDPGDDAARSSLREGPIQSGGYLMLGTFEDIILGRDVGLRGQDGEEGGGRSILDAERLKGMETLEICVAVLHGQVDEPIGARRSFFVEQREGESAIRAYSIYTEQLVKRRKRDTVRHWVESRLEPKVRGSGQDEATDQGQA